MRADRSQSIDKCTFGVVSKGDHFKRGNADWECTAVVIFHQLQVHKL